MSDHALDVVMFAEKRTKRNWTAFWRAVWLANPPSSTKWHKFKTAVLVFLGAICTSRLGTAVPHWRAA
ncbi:hypothetical protein ACLK19_20695 [Escherichia coli]